MTDLILTAEFAATTAISLTMLAMLRKFGAKRRIPEAACCSSCRFVKEGGNGALRCAALPPVPGEFQLDSFFNGKDGVLGVSKEIRAVEWQFPPVKPEALCGKWEAR